MGDFLCRQVDLSSMTLSKFWQKCLMDNEERMFWVTERSDRNVIIENRQLGSQPRETYVT